MEDEISKEKLYFIDLFAGIGGFHMAVKNFDKNADCVLACEIDKNCSMVYYENFGITTHSDIREISESDIDKFNLLCAGFPCQPFSKGGKQEGFSDKIRGTLFFDIVRLIKYHKPEYILLENVANIIKHDFGNTYRVIKETISSLDYFMPENPIVISPLDIGIPVHRKRAFILARKNRPFHSTFDIKINSNTRLENPTDVIKFFKLKKLKNESLNISEYEKKLLSMWNEFKLNVTNSTWGFPIWLDELNELPAVKTEYKWKDHFIKKNKELYNRNKAFIESWKEKHKPNDWITNKSHRKFEWQGGEISNIQKGLIQFRPSGIRVSKINYFNTLVAMNHTQIIGPLQRRLSIDELKLLQGFPKNFKLSKSKYQSAKQLGNSVNIHVVNKVLEFLIRK